MQIWLDMSDLWRHYNGPVKLSPFSLRSAEREQNEERHIKNEMDVVHTEYNRIRTSKDGMVV